MLWSNLLKMLWHLKHLKMLKLLWHLVRFCTEMVLSGNRPGLSRLNQPRAAHLSAGHKAGHMEQN